MDLDGLKAVNDRYGHAAGDEMLKRFASALHRPTRGSDVVVRMGGDESLVVHLERKREMVQRVMNRLTGLHLTVNGDSIPISFSAGWTNYVHGQLTEDLLKRADDALYVHKRHPHERFAAIARPVEEHRNV